MVQPYAENAIWHGGCIKKKWGICKLNYIKKMKYCIVK